jgi:hypothetical protein
MRNRSFILIQLNGRKIRGTFHEDHLKTFVPRTGYVAAPDAPVLSLTQIIRKERKRKRQIDD